MMLQQQQNLQAQRQLEQQQQQQVAAMMKTPAMSAARPPSQATDRPMAPPTNPAGHFDINGMNGAEQPQPTAGPSAGPSQQPNMASNQQMSGGMNLNMPQFIRAKFTSEQMEAATAHTKNIMAQFMQKGMQGKIVHFIARRKLIVVGICRSE